MRRIILIVLTVLFASALFPLSAYAEEASTAQATPTAEPTAQVTPTAQATLQPDPTQQVDVSDKAKITVPVAKAGFWESSDPIFTIGFNTIKVNGTITVDDGELTNIITIVSNPNDKKDGVTAGMFARHWTLPEGASIQIYDKNDAVVADNTNLATGMKISITDKEGKQLPPYTVVVTGNLSGNSKFTLAGYVSMLNHLIQQKSLTPLQAAAADLNQNGRVDIGDLAMMVGIML